MDNMSKSDKVTPLALCDDSGSVENKSLDRCIRYLYIDGSRVCYLKLGRELSGQVRIMNLEI